MRSLPLASAALVLGSIPAAQGLDETWTLSVNGQTVQANADGSFRIPNISAVDQFGAGGPGTSPDFLSDQSFRVLGVAPQPDGTTLYAISPYFQLQQSQVFLVDDLVISSLPPVVGATLDMTASRSLLGVGETVQITTTATLSDSTQLDVTTDNATSYQTSNLDIASVDSTGLLTAQGQGFAFVTVINQGITDTLGFNIVDDKIDTTLVGFVMLDNGTFVSGADLRSNFGGSATSAADGSFLFQVGMPGDTGVTVFGDALIGGVNYIGASSSVPGVEDGFTDVGLVVLNPGYLGPIFANPVFATGDAPIGGTSGDIDGDGDRDIVTADSADSRVTILLNNGEGLFLPSGTLVTGGGPTDVVLGDLDGDDDLDLIVIEQTGASVRTFFNPGDGVFQSGAALGVGLSPIAGALGDLDGDNDLDLLVADQVNTSSCGAPVHSLLNDGTGTFIAAGSFCAGPAPAALALGDLNGDLVLDAVVANDQSSTQLASVLIGDGGGGFGAPLAIGVGARGRSAITQDFDGDFVLDVAISDPDADTIEILYGIGDGTFGSPTSLAGQLSPVALDAADLDGIQGVDLLVANQVASGTVTAHLNDGLGGFPGSSTYAVGSLPSDVTSGDMDGDGDQDVVTINEGGDSASLLYGTGDGSLGAFDELAVGGESPGFAVADLDNDGDLDIVAADTTADQVAVIENNGDGTYAAPVGYGTGVDPHSITIGDLDGDADFDLAVANSGSASISILFNNGDGTFGLAVSIPVGLTPWIIHTDDLDNDTDLDLAVSDFGNATIVILVNVGGGSFVTQATLPTGLLPGSLAMGDLDGDRVPDLANTTTSLFGPSLLSVHLNNGDATFAPEVIYSAGTGPSFVTMADLDGDGALDLAVADSGSNGVVILLNNGDGSFGLPVTYGAAVLPDAIAAADFDGDGDQDLAVTARIELFSNNSLVHLLFNNGNGTFSAGTQYGAQIGAGLAVAADMDNDGDLDLGVANPGVGTISVHDNVRIP